MANAWAFSALSAGLAFIAKLIAIEFEVITELPEIAVGTVGRLITDVISDAGGLQTANQRNQFPGSTEFTRQLNGDIRRCAIADRGFVMSCIFGVIGFLQPAA